MLSDQDPCDLNSGFVSEASIGRKEPRFRVTSIPSRVLNWCGNQVIRYLLLIIFLAILFVLVVLACNWAIEKVYELLFESASGVWGFLKGAGEQLKEWVPPRRF